MSLFFHHVMVVTFGCMCGIWIYASIRWLWTHWHVVEQRLHYSSLFYEDMKYRVMMRWVTGLGVATFVLFLLSRFLTT